MPSAKFPACVPAELFSVSRALAAWGKAGWKEQNVFGKDHSAPGAASEPA